MELNFPEGCVDRSMPPETQYRFYETMKNVVWAIDTDLTPDFGEDDSEHQHGSGFCVDKSGLIVTAQHVVKGAIRVSARPYGQNDFYQCKIVLEWAHFDLALLKIEYRITPERVGFHYAKIAGEQLFNIPVATEVFMIGFPLSQGPHFLRGTIGYDHNVDGVNFEDLARDKGPYEKRFDVENSGYYKDLPYRVEMDTELLVHPCLPMLQVNAVADIPGASGSPIFNANGIVIGILAHGLHSLRGVPASALSTAINFYLSQEKKNKKEKKKRNNR